MIECHRLLSDLCSMCLFQATITSPKCLLSSTSSWCTNCSHDDRPIDNLSRKAGPLPEPLLVSDDCTILSASTYFHDFTNHNHNDSDLRDLTVPSDKRKKKQ